MRILALLAILTICSYASLSVQSYEESQENSSLSMPRIRFSNSTQNNINGFIAYYYFTSAEPNPVFEPYYMEGGIGSIEHISGVNYRVKLDFSAVSLPSGSDFPNNSGISFGLHYASWANWTKEDDYSNNMSQAMTSNNSIIVTSVNGQLLAGTYPNFSISEPNQQKNVMARVYALKDGESNFAKIRLYVKNEGKIALDHFDFSIEITAENRQQPVLNTWHIPNTTYTIEQKNDSVWALHFSTKGVSLEPNSMFPSGEGIYFGISYSNWSNVNTQNDYSLKGLQNQYSLASQIPLYIDGKLISGNPKIHGIADIKKIIADENNYSLGDFNRSVESLLADIPDGDKNDFWDNLDVFFKDVPNYDSTLQAVEQIFLKFPGLDTLTFVSLWKEIKASYEQLVRLRMHKWYAVGASGVKVLSKAIFYDDCGDSYSKLKPKEFELLFWSPLKVPGSVRAKNRAWAWAEEYAEKIGLEDALGNRADGFRHAVWNALLCRETGTQYDNVDDCLKWAKDFTTAHESMPLHCNVNALDSTMDMHNNAIGREKYKPYLHVNCEWSLFGFCLNEEVVGLSREGTKDMFLRLASIGYGFNKVSQLGSSPWVNSIVFLKADNGKLYCRDEQNANGCEAFKDPNTMPVKIGVLKKNPTICNEEFSFYLDLEDSDSDNKIISGDKNPPGIQISNGGVRFTYCRLDIDGEYGPIPRVPYDYIVLRLSDNCPFGTYPFRRYHDTEDDNNSNSNPGNIGPNAINRNATLEYCFVPADENSVLEYPFEDDYGIFANISSETIIHSEIKLDDEDDNNNNSWDWYKAPNDIQTRIKEIMNGKSNTIYHVVSYIVIVWNAIVNFFFG